MSHPQQTSLFTKEKKGTWVYLDLWESLDGTVRVLKKDFMERIQICLETTQGKFWYDVRNILQETVKNSEGELERLFSKEKTFFYPLAKRQDSRPHIYVSEPGNPNKLRYLIYTDEVVLTDTEGTPSNVKLIPLDTLQSLDPSTYDRIAKGVASPYLASSVDLRPSVFYDLQMKRIHSLHYTACNISFYGEEVKSNWMLRCKEHPDLFLHREQIVPLFNHIQIGLILINLVTNEKKIAIPANNSMRLCAFHSHTSLLTCETPDDYLELMFLFCRLKDFEKAIFYLPKASKFQFYDLKDILDIFKKLKSQAPEALGFYLKFALQLYDNFTQPLYVVPQRPEVKKLFAFNQWILKVYSRYLRALSTYESNRVPFNFRLTLTEEKRLVNNLTIYHKQLSKEVKEEEYSLEESFRLKLLEMRFQLQNVGKYIGVTLPFSILCYPKEMKYPSFITDKIWDFVEDRRYDEKSPYHAFMALYERALVAAPRPSAIDLDLFFFFRSLVGRKEETLNNLRGVLLSVRKNPSLFKDLHFKKGCQFSEFEKTFDEIVQRLSTLYQKLKTAALFVHQYATHSQFGSFAIDIKLPATNTLEPLPWKLPDLRADEIRQMLRFPLQKICSQYFLTAATEEPLKPFFLKKEHSSSAMQTRIMENLEKGFLEKQSLVDFEFQLPLSELKDELKGTLKVTEGEQQELLFKSESLANSRGDGVGKVALKTLKVDLKHFLRIEGRQQSRITLEKHLIPAILIQDVSQVRSLNPLLKPQEIAYVIYLTYKYLILSCKITQIKQALVMIQGLENCSPDFVKEKTQELGLWLHWKCEYDPIAIPEVLIYSYKNLQLPRKNQQGILNWREKFSTENRLELLFAFEAGGGKSSFLKAISKAKALSQGYLPVSVTPASLYPIDRENLKASLENCFDQKLAVLEIGLDKPLTPSEEENCLRFLRKCISDKKHLMFTPETYFALFLKYMTALVKKNVESVAHLSLCLNLLEEQGYGFIDECRETLAPLTQAKIGLGKPVPLPKGEREVILKVYKILAGELDHKLRLEDGRKIDEVVRIEKNAPEALTENDIALIRNKIIDYFLESIPADQKNTIRSYWKDISAPVPPFLNTLFEKNPKSANVIVCLKQVLLHIMPLALKMVKGTDYRSSMIASREFYVPRKKRQPTSAIYEDPYLTACLTLQGFLQQELNEAQAEKMMHLISSLHISQVYVGIKPDETEMSLLWKKWFGAEQPSLKEVLSDKNWNRSLLKTKKEAIFWYVERFVLRQIVSSPEHLICTPVHLMNAFKKKDLFSAYPGLPELYSLKDAIQRDDNHFHAKVLDRLCEKSNSTIVRFSSLELSSIFTGILSFSEADRNLLSSIIDVGDVLRNYPNNQVAEEFLLFSDKHHLNYDGVLFFKESETDAEDNQLMLLLKESNDPLALVGSDIQKALQLHGLIWENLKLLTIYDISHTRGSHVLQPPQGVAFFLVGGHFDLSDLIQGPNRCVNFF